VSLVSLVGHIRSIISEPTGVQIQFTLAVSSGLTVILTLFPLTANSKFIAF